MNDAVNGLPSWLAPVLPAEAVSFDCVDFGGYCPRGYDPSRVTARITGIPLAELTQGQWLGHKNTGGSGSSLIFRDAAGRELGRAYKCSLVLARELFMHGPLTLTFIPVGAPAKL